MAVVRRVPTFGFVLLGLVVAVVLVVVAPFASPDPDGLEKVSDDHGIDAAVVDHHLADSPLADYAVGGVDNDVVTTGLAGIAGILVTFSIGAGLIWVVRRRRASLSADRAGPAAA